ncbi:hypothetical protein M3231_18750 [Neobacillus mesonae]|nr:hypothetical protein [Neobacillus mesonae]
MDNKDILKIEPGVGIGKIKLGMTKEELAVYEEEYLKEYPEKPWRDIGFEHLFRIDYDVNHRISFIEIINYDMEHMNFDCLYEDINLFSTKAKDLVLTINEISPYKPDEYDMGYSYHFPEIGLVLWRGSVFHEEQIHEAWFQEMPMESQEQELRYLYFETVSVMICNYYNDPEQTSINYLKAKEKGLI